MWTPLARSTSASPGSGDGHAEHPCHRARLPLVDLERGVRRNGKLIAGDIQRHIGTIRTIAQHEHLSETCLERIEKAERVVPKMRATIEFVSGYVHQQVRQMDLARPCPTPCMPSSFPHSISIAWPRPRAVTAGEPLRALAERMHSAL